MIRRHVIMFQPRFALLVESGVKLQTIRPLRKRCPIFGDVIDAREWTGRPYRSKQRKLGDRLALGTEGIVIHADGIEFSPGTLRYAFWHEQRADLVNTFARADGFKDWAAMRAWFSATHALPFEGVLIKWK